jgi:hypothetical protein
MSDSLILLIGSLTLFVAFFGLLMVEAQTGRRVFDGTRRSLDRRVRRVEFIVRHVDWAEFLAHIVQSIGARIAHDIAHISLLVVRFLERQLTRTVRYLRDRKPNVLAPKPSRESMVSQARNYVQEMLPKVRKKRQMKHEEDISRV